MKLGSNNKEIPSDKELKHLLDITIKYCFNEILLNQFSDESDKKKIARQEHIKNLTNPEKYPTQVFEKINSIFQEIQDDFVTQFKFHPIHIGFVSCAISSIFNKTKKDKPFFVY